jgi:hypothetical protein
MGWNSWDSYGFTIDENEFKANAAVLASLKPYGWTYAVIDEGWYMGNPFGDKLAARAYRLDGFGRLIPDPARFLSSVDGAGFKPLADWLHAQGLKFGLHIVRGIPKDAVATNLPIAGSTFSVVDAADTADTCPWDDGNYGVRDNEAGQAYYDSLMRLYADWGVDFVKVDCIADHPYKANEIRQIALAIKKTGRPIVLSLSPGPTNLSHAAEVAQYSQMWRIANDLWDGWSFAPPWPNGLRSAFDNLASWAPYAKAGNWPDADMLPFGALEPHPGWGEPRQSRLTQDEERTQFTLWAIARSPLILGGNLTKLDDFERTLITNKDLIAVNQTVWESHPVDYKKGEDFVTWEAFTGPRDKPIRYFAYFNLSDDEGTFVNLVEPDHSVHHFIDLWNGKDYAVKISPDTVMLHTGLNPHQSQIFRLE